MAAAKASWAASSATSKSPNKRIRVALIRPQSDRYKASTAESEVEDMADNKKFMIRVSIPAVPVRLTNGGTQKMKYMLLVYLDEKALSDDEREHCYVESAQLTQDLNIKG